MRWFRLVALPQPLEGHDRSRHAFAVTYTALPAYFDFEDAFARCFIGNDGNVSEFEAGGLVRPQAGVSHEENKIVELLSCFFPIWICRILCSISRSFVEPLIFFGREPRPVRDFARRLVWRRQVRQ